jgi:hypothetical protein
MNLLNIIATLTLQDSDYKKKLAEDTKATEKDTSKTEASNKKKLRSFLKVVAIVAALITAVVKLSKATIAYGNSISKGAKETNMSNEAYQKWLLTAESVGASQSDLNSGFASMNDLLKGASDGEASSMIALNKLGLSYTDFQNLKPEDQLKLLVNTFQQMADGTEKTQLAQDIFGSSASALMPILSDQSKSVDDLWQNFTDLGLVMSNDNVNASSELSGQYQLLGMQFKNVAYQIGEVLYPALKWLADLLSFAVEQFSNMPDWLKTTTVVLAGLTAGIIAAGIAWNAGFGWLTLIIDAIGALIIGILELWKNWDTVSQWLTDSWKKVSDFFIEVGQHISDFFKGVWDGMVAGFKGFINFFIDGLNGMISGLNRVSFKIPDWIPNIGGQTWGIQIPLIPRLQKGTNFIPKDMFPAYLDYGERVLTKKENEQYSALGGSEGIENLVNGIGGAIGNNKTTNKFNIVVRIGEKEFKDYVYKVVDDSMKQKGLQSLRKVGGYD